MKNSVGDPSENIKEGVLVFREDVAQICAVHDVLKSGKHADPDVRSPIGRDEFARVEQDEIGQHRKEWKEELSSERDCQRPKKESSNKSLEQRPGDLNNRKAEETDNGYEQVLCIVDGPLMRPESL